VLISFHQKITNTKKNVGGFDACSQCHQYFMSNFLPILFFQKKLETRVVA
jgi:hypothetical protein